MNINFEKLDHRRTMNVEVPGYRYILKIDYGLHRLYRDQHLTWKVVGTNKVFNIPLKIVTEHCGAKYDEHFIDVLGKLREDILVWNDQGLPEKFMEDYWDDFGTLIF